MNAATPTYQQVLATASAFLASFKDHTLEVLDLSKPPDIDYALHLAKVISKLSPMLGNTIEYRLTAELNKRGGWPVGGKWMRQDSGFPDTIFAGSIAPTPGIEIKTWFPLATEITARFKDSITYFKENQTNVAMLAWIPESIIFGKAKLIDVWYDSAYSVALARDTHYHRPPGYLVFEPEDTSARTKNLQQTNTNGYEFQGTPEQLAEAQKVVDSWGKDGKEFSFASKYQTRLRTLLAHFPYRLDTNFAKMDRIEHTSLEQFKERVLGTMIGGHTIKEWKGILKRASQRENVAIIKKLIGL